MPTSFAIETQQKFRWCWAAVAATIARYFSPDLGITQSQIAKRVLHPNENVDCSADGQCDQMKGLEEVFKVLNGMLPSPINKGRTPTDTIPIEDLKYQIDQGRPVCARIQWSGEDGGHFVIISGYSKSQTGEWWVDVRDPYFEDSTVPYQELVSNYLEAGWWSDTYLLDQV